MNLLKKLSFPIFLLVGIAFYYYRYSPKSIEINSLEIVDLNGNSIDLDTYKNKPLVINFWATWCGTCIKEMPAFQKAQSELAGKVNFIYISEEDSNTILKSIRDRNFKGSFYKTTQAFEKLGIRSWPVTYFYNSEGKLEDTKAGLLSYEKLVEFYK